MPFQTEEFVKAIKSIFEVTCILLSCLLLGAFNLITFVTKWVSENIFDYWDFIMERSGRRRIILNRDNKNPYLIRYYLLFKNREESYFNIFLHQFIQGDSDEDLHDHPWGYMTFIICGGYHETVFEYDQNGTFTGEEDTIWRGAGYCTYRKSTSSHRITLDEERSDKCWTLFIPLKRHRTWGFWKKTDKDYKWIESEQYFKEKKSN